MKKIIISMMLVAFFGESLIAQSGQGTRGAGEHLNGVVEGVIQDSKTQLPMEYANIILYNQKDSIQVTGTITDKRGHFQLTRLNAGTYFLEAAFIGYERYYQDKINVSAKTMIVDLGTISLNQTTLSSDNIIVEGERPPISYQIDKKVIDVTSQVTAAAGTAAEVLENAPSVTVDIEGNVSLRGSGSFTVLIDGRPTILDAQDALQQIPASTIDNIELITNPSAKYDPEGTSGIINIVLKKNALEGVSGLMTANGGTFGNYGTDVTLTYKNDDYTALISADYNERTFPGSRIEESWTTHQDVTSYLNSDGSSERGGIRSGIRAAFEYRMTPSDMLTIGGRYGEGGRIGSNRNFFTEWSSVNPIAEIYTSIGDNNSKDTFYTLNLDYLHNFGSKGHELTGQLLFNNRSRDSESLTELLNTTGNIVEGQKNSEWGPENEFRIKIDYIYPLNETNKFEAGYQTELENSEEHSGYYLYDTNTDNYLPQAEYFKNALYSENTSSLYSIYSGEFGRLGYQAGLRGEYTFRDIRLSDTDQQFTIDRWDYFPSLHSSFELSGVQQLMASYSRRIHRPRGWELEPFTTWMDAHNVRTGNPGLLPEYIDSYELGYQTYIGKALFSAETYYRVANNKVERIQSVYDENVTLHSVENVGTDYALGSEFMLRLGLSDFWNVNLMGNIYNYRIEGTLYDMPFSRESYNWNTRMNNSFTLWKNGLVQFNLFYHSPSVSAQGTREGFIMSDLAIRQDFLNRKFSAILQVRDLFGTANREFISEGQDFYKYNYMERESPLLMLTLRLNINNYKNGDRRAQQNTGSDYFDGEEEF